MPHAHARPRRSPFRRACAQAFVLSLIPLGTAFAQANQSLPYVRITRDKTEIRSLRQVDDVRMTAPQGAVLEVIYIEGDRYVHRDSNWYWVLLPSDPWATRPAGWVRGDAVEHLAAPQPAATAQASRAEVPQVKEVPVKEARTEPREMAPAPLAPTPVPVEDVRSTSPVLYDVVLHFPFGKSGLTEDAKRTLASALVARKPDTRLSVALEGHADWVGSEAFNERLGLDRAESVRQYLAEQFRIPADQIRVVSFGESSPAAPNTTREGRAQNRRVVIKGGA
jgi:outer membrane protein OmpA-like peptidoglycan-associated protein